LVLLVMESWKKLLSISPWHSAESDLISPWHSAESELSNCVLFVLCRLHQQERRRDGASYRKPDTSSSR
jgi:hypothetical protein